MLLLAAGLFFATESRQIDSSTQRSPINYPYNPLTLPKEIFKLPFVDISRLENVKLSKRGEIPQTITFEYDNLIITHEVKPINSQEVSTKFLRYEIKDNRNPTPQKNVLLKIDPLTLIGIGFWRNLGEPRTMEPRYGVNVEGVEDRCATYFLHPIGDEENRKAEAELIKHSINRDGSNGYEPTEVTLINTPIVAFPIGAIGQY